MTIPMISSSKNDDLARLKATPIAYRILQLKRLLYLINDVEYNSYDTSSMVNKYSNNTGRNRTKIRHDQIELAQFLLNSIESFFLHQTPQDEYSECNGSNVGELNQDVGMQEDDRNLLDHLRREFHVARNTIQSESLIKNKDSRNLLENILYGSEESKLQSYSDKRQDKKPRNNPRNRKLNSDTHEDKVIAKISLKKNSPVRSSSTRTNIERVSLKEQEEDATKTLQDEITEMAEQLKNSTLSINNTLSHQNTSLSEMEYLAQSNLDKTKDATEKVQEHVKKGWRKSVGRWMMVAVVLGMWMLAFLTIRVVPKRKDACFLFCKRHTSQPKQEKTQNHEQYKQQEDKPSIPKSTKPAAKYSYCANSHLKCTQPMTSAQHKLVEKKMIHHQDADKKEVREKVATIVFRQQLKRMLINKRRAEIDPAYTLVARDGWNRHTYADGVQYNVLRLSKQIMKDNDMVDEDANDTFDDVVDGDTNGDSYLNEIVENDTVDDDMVDDDMVDHYYYDDDGDMVGNDDDDDMVDNDMVDDDMVDDDTVDDDMIDDDMIDDDITDDDMIDDDIADDDMIDNDMADDDVVDNDNVDDRVGDDGVVNKDFTDGDIVDSNVIDNDIGDHNSCDNKSFNDDAGDACAVDDKVQKESKPNVHSDVDASNSDTRPMSHESTHSEDQNDNDNENSNLKERRSDDKSSKTQIISLSSKSKEYVEFLHIVIDSATENNTSKLQTMINDDPRLVHVRDENGWQIIHLAAAKGQLNYVKILVELGEADINSRVGPTLNGGSVLWMVVSYAEFGADHPVFSYLKGMGAQLISPETNDG